MRIQRKVKCKMCGYKLKKEWVYRDWSFISCFESIISHNDLIVVTWVKTWWLCRECYKPAYPEELRFLDIDGFTYFLSWKFPFVRRG